MTKKNGFLKLPFLTCIFIRIEEKIHIKAVVDMCRGKGNGVVKVALLSGQMTCLGKGFVRGTGRYGEAMRVF